jgi:hypothetical protein
MKWTSYTTSGIHMGKFSILICRDFSDAPLTPSRTSRGGRIQDIPPLTEFFVTKFAACLNKPLHSIPG